MTAAKRVLDLLGAGAGLVLLLPFGLVVGVCSKLADGGPVLYRQVRVGRYGRPFRILKFRSMVVYADRLGHAITQGQDPRITPLGRFLRKTKLDELPQLWNVLLGEMSLVGPRPEVPRYVEHYTPEQLEVLRCKPGITDLASLLFRDEEALLRGAADVEQFYLRYCLPKKIELNLEYARRAGVLQDCWIILQTLWRVGLGAVALACGGLARGRPGVCVASAPQPPGRRVAVIGTGPAALGVAQDLCRCGEGRRRIVAFFDDDPRAWHKRLDGIPVVGMPECLLNAQWREGIDEVIVALPERDEARRQQLGELLKMLPVKTNFAAAPAGSGP